MCVTLRDSVTLISVFCLEKEKRVVAATRGDISPGGENAPAPFY